VVGVKREALESGAHLLLLIDPDEAGHSLQALTAYTYLTELTRAGGWTPRARSSARTQSTSRSRDKDLAEAKKLLGAAGYAGSAPFDYYINTTASAANRVADVLLGMVTDAGFKGLTVCLAY